MFNLATEESNKVLCQSVSNIGALLISRIYATSAFCLGLLPTLILYISFVLLSFCEWKLIFKKKRNICNIGWDLGDNLPHFLFAHYFEIYPLVQNPVLLIKEKKLHIFSSSRLQHSAAGDDVRCFGWFVSMMFGIGVNPLDFLNFVNIIA